MTAAVHGVDGPVDELVTLQLASFVVLDLVTRQQPVTEKTDSGRQRQMRTFVTDKTVMITENNTKTNNKVYFLCA